MQRAAAHVTHQTGRSSPLSHCVVHLQALSLARRGTGARWLGQTFTAMFLKMPQFTL